MKKRLLIGIFFSVILFSVIISAVEVNIKEEINQGETILAKVSGNFLTALNEEKIYLYRGHNRVPATPYIIKIEGDYYIYIQSLGKIPGNYSLIISGARYTQLLGEVSEEDIIRNFTITKGIADFLINPGFITTEKEFIIEAQNLQDKSITIETLIKDYEEGKKGLWESLFSSEGNATNKVETFLKTGETKEIEFTLINITGPILKLAELTSKNTTYNVPVYILKTKEEIIEEVEETDLNETKEEIKKIKENITKEEENKPATAKTCKELRGIICKSGEICGCETSEDKDCRGETKNAKDGICCFGKCRVPEKSSTGKIIGWLMVFIIAGFVYWYFKTQYKKAKKPINLLELAKSRKK